MLKSFSDFKKNGDDKLLHQILQYYVCTWIFFVFSMTVTSSLDVSLGIRMCQLSEGRATIIRIYENMH